MVKCAECDMMIGTAEDSMQLHKMEFHTLRVCDQCQVSIEAYKLPEHKVSRVSKPSLKIGTANSICWNSLGLNRWRFAAPIFSEGFGVYLFNAVQVQYRDLTLFLERSVAELIQCRFLLNKLMWSTNILIGLELE